MAGDMHAHTYTYMHSYAMTHMDVRGQLVDSREWTQAVRLGIK